MGGGFITNNSSAVSEYNIWVDPEAMEVVLQSGCKITLVPLDATHEAYLTVKDAEVLRSYGTKTADAVAAIIEKRSRGYANDVDMKEYAAAPHPRRAGCLCAHRPDRAGRRRARQLPCGHRRRLRRWADLPGPPYAYHQRRPQLLFCHARRPREV